MVLFRLLIFLCVLASPALYAIDAQHFHPNINGQGMLSLETSKVLTLNQFAVGLAQNFVHRPLEFGRSSSGVRVDAVSEWYWSWDFWAAYGIWERVDLALNIPFSLLSRVEPVTSSSKKTTQSMGDLKFALKLNLLLPEENSARIGLALAPFLTVPTGDSEDFYGEASFSGGFIAAIDRYFFEDYLVSLNAGFKAGRKEAVRVSGINLLTVDEEFLFGVGLSFPLVKAKSLFMVSEFVGRSDFQRESNTPLEARIGVEKGFFRNEWIASFGGGFGINSGYGSPQFRIIGGLRYSPKLKRQNPLSTSERGQGRGGTIAHLELAARRIVIFNPIYFEVASEKLLKISHKTLDAVAHILLNNRKIRRVRIEGHSDSDGSKMYNLKLSQKRAESVEKYLIKKGLSKTRLIAIGRGETQPLVANINEKNKKKNRRVEFHIIEMEE